MFPFGIDIYNQATGKLIASPDGAGGVYLRTVLQPAGQSGSVSFPEAFGLTLALYQIASGSHSWTVDVDGAGNPRINFSANPGTGGLVAIAWPTNLMVFAS